MDREGESEREKERRHIDVHSGRRIFVMQIFAETTAEGGERGGREGSGEIDERVELGRGGWTGVDGIARIERAVHDTHADDK